METVANVLGYVCISTPVEDRLQIQMSEDVTINQVNEALYGLVSNLNVYYLKCLHIACCILDQQTT